MHVHIDPALLPPGWSAQSRGSHTALVTLEDGTHKEHVTLDFDRRIFAPGTRTPSTRGASNTRTYNGPGRQDAMIQDAIDWLRKTLCLPSH